MDAVLADPATAPITESEKTLLAFIASVNGGSWALTPEHVAPVRDAGWSDEALYDAVSVCALFNFYNRWCDGCGVQPMAHQDHAQSGRRLASFGYLPPG